MKKRHVPLPPVEDAWTQLLPSSLEDWEAKPEELALRMLAAFLEQLRQASGAATFSFAEAKQVIEQVQSVASAHPANAVLQEALRCAASGDLKRAGEWIGYLIADGVKRETDTVHAGIRRESKRNRCEVLEENRQSQPPAERWPKAEKDIWRNEAQAYLKRHPDQSMSATARHVLNWRWPNDDGPNERTVERAIQQLFKK